jgi:hypothetical protein
MDSSLIAEVEALTELHGLVGQTWIGRALYARKAIPLEARLLQWKEKTNDILVWFNSEANKTALNISYISFYQDLQAKVIVPRLRKIRSDREIDEELSVE